MDIAQYIVMQVAQGDFAAVEQRLADHFKAFYPPGAIQTTWQALEQRFGAFQGLGKTTAVQTPQGLGQMVTCVFERASFDVKIVLNGAGQITGFTITPASPALTPSGPYPGRSPSQQPQRPSPSARRGCLACLPYLALPILLLGLLVGGTWLLIQSLQRNPSFVSFYSSNYDTLLVLLSIGAFAIIPVALLAGRRTALGKVLAGGAVALVLIVIVGVLLIGSINPHIGLTRTGFSITSLTVGSRTPVTFDNPSDGVTQTLCLGRDQHCDPFPGDTLPLAQGLVIHPGQSVSVAFGLWGEYHITSKTTPHMNLVITISRPTCNRQSPCSGEFPIYGTESQNGADRSF